MKANRKFIEKEAGVSAVIEVILMVCITVAIAATNYYYVKSVVTDNFCHKGILRGYVLTDYNRIVVILHDLKSNDNDSFYVTECIFDNYVNIHILDNLTGKYISISGYSSHAMSYKNPYNVNLIKRIQDIDMLKNYYMYC